MRGWFFFGSVPVIHLDFLFKDVKGWKTLLNKSLCLYEGPMNLSHFLIFVSDVLSRFLCLFQRLGALFLLRILPQGDRGSFS